MFLPGLGAKSAAIWRLLPPNLTSAGTRLCWPADRESGEGDTVGQITSPDRELMSPSQFAVLAALSFPSLPVRPTPEQIAKIGLPSQQEVLQQFRGLFLRGCTGRLARSGYRDRRKPTSMRR